MLKKVGSTVFHPKHKATCHCLEGANPYEIANVRIVDGVNHPADQHGWFGAIVI